MKKVKQVLSQEVKEKCQICSKRPVEIYQLDYEVCCYCHDMETLARFIDMDIPEV